MGVYRVGVTAWSAEDAFALVRERGWEVVPDEADVREDMLPHEFARHVWSNAGPAFSEEFGIRA